MKRTLDSLFGQHALQLPELLDLVERSEEEDWHRLPRTPFAEWEHCEGPGDRSSLVPIYYGQAFAHKGNLDVVLAWGAERTPDQHRSLKRVSWVIAGGFHHDECPLTEVVILYGGQSIIEFPFVYLDNSHLLVPIPEVASHNEDPQRHFLDPREATIGRLVYALFADAGTTGTMDDVFAQCGVAVEG